MIKILFRFAINIIALLVVNHLVADFELIGQPTSILAIAIIFAVFNIYLRPVMKLIFSPLILITLGAFSLVINAGILYLLDIISNNITINGLTPLWQATLIITVFNLIIGILL